VLQSFRCAQGKPSGTLVQLQTQNGKIKIENGIRYISANVYPNEFNGDKDSQRAAIKRVRARVQYACEQGILTGPDAKEAII
jgi:hypothetical protein